MDFLKRLFSHSRTGTPNIEKQAAMVTSSNNKLALTVSGEGATAAKMAALTELRARGISPDTLIKGEPQLVVAARANDYALVRLLVAAGCNVNQKGVSTNTALHETAANGEKEMLGLLLAANANTNASNSRSIRPLNFAVSSKNSEAVELLLKAGADPNARGEDGGTCLHEAAVSGSEIIVRTLLNHGADMTVKKSPQWGGSSVLHCAVSGGPAILDLLLNAGADASMRDLEGDTILHEAVNHCYEDVVSLLLKRKVDASAKNNNGKTPLFLLGAANAKAVSIATLLLKNGASKEEKDAKGQTAEEHLYAKDAQWGDFFITGSLAVPPGTPDNASDYVVDACRQAVKFSTALERAKTFIERGERSDSKEDIKSLGRLALENLPTIDECLSNLYKATEGDSAFQITFLIVRACLLCEEVPYSAARRLLSSLDNRLRELRYVEHNEDIVFDKIRLASKLLHLETSENSKDRLRIDRVEDVNEVMNYVETMISSSVIKVDSSWVNDMHMLSYHKHLSPVFLKTRQEVLSSIRSSLGRMRADSGFWAFFADISFTYRCIHIESSHEDESTKYRKHVLVWVVDDGYAVAESDHLYVFGQWSPSL